MKRLAFVLASCGISMSPLLAKTYSVQAVGDRWLVTPASFQLQVQPWDEQPKPNCTELMSTLQKNAATIDRCLPGASQPATACRLLKTVLPKAIFGVDDPVNGVAEDVEQFFEVVQSDFEALPDLATIATAEGLPLARLSLYAQSPWPLAVKQQDLKIVGGANSYLPKLVQLDYLKDDVGVITLGTDGSYGVRDRVSYCEIVGGQSQIEGKGLYKAQVKQPASAESLDWTFGLYQRLSLLTYPLAGTPEQQALTIGYEMGRYSIENPQPQGKGNAIAELYRLFYEKSGNTLKLKSMSKTQLQITLTETVDVDVSSPFQTHN